MLKLTAIVSLMLIGSTIWAASFSCGSCGSECASSCGTRRFRSCCFNYLRKKRGPEAINFYTPTQEDKENQPRSRLPMNVVENIPMPEQWMANILSKENYPYWPNDMNDNHILEV